MNRQLFEKAGIAAYGNTWQTDISKDLNITDRTVRNWLKDDSVKASNGELITVLNMRKGQISKVINELETSVPVLDNPDWDKKLTAVSDGGELLDDVFESLEDAQKWVANQWGQDDDYLTKYHQMTLAEHTAMQVIQHYSDVYDPASVLRLIEDIEQYSDNKTKQDVFIELAKLDDKFWGKEYYQYYLTNEFALNVSSDIEQNTYNSEPPITYKQFIRNKLNAAHDFLINLD